MPVYLGYFFLGAGVLLFLYSWYFEPPRSRPLMFAATMMIMGGLAILQFAGTETPGYQ